MEIKVFQGENNLAVDNKLLGRFSLSGIESNTRGAPQIEVTCDVNVHGVIYVTAQDKSSGEEKTCSYSSLHVM